MNEWISAEHHAEKAHQFYESGQWDKALAELKLALAVNPDQSDWHFGMGLTLEALHRHEEAIDSFEQVLRLRGEDIDAALHLGVAQLRSGMYQQTIASLERITEQDPAHEPAYCYRIAAYAQLGQHDAAEQMFYLAQQIDDQCPQCFDHIAMSLAMRGDLDRAVWCWQRALKLDPHYPDAYANLARAHWQRGQHDRAAGYFLQHLRVDPGDIDTLLQLGVLLAETGKHAQAREKFNRVLELDPGVTDAYVHLGELSLLAGRLETAAAELEMASRLAPEKTGVHLLLAKVALKRQDDREVVRTHLLAEAEREGHNPFQALQLARLLIQVGIPKPVLEVLKGFPSMPDASAQEGTLSRVTPDTLPAPGTQQRAEAMELKGVALVLLGYTRAGIVHCRRAVRLAPQNAEAMGHLAAAYLKLGKPVPASAWLSRAIILRPTDHRLRTLRRGLRWMWLRNLVGRSPARIVKAVLFWK